MNDIIYAAIAFLGFCMPLLGSAMIPDTRQRHAAALFALIGIGIIISLTSSTNPQSFTIGLAAGMIAATLKLVTGSRWL